MFELIFIFISFIIKIIKFYLLTILPTLIIISVICVLIGMCIRSGMKGGLSILIIIITIVIFTFVIYGKNTVKIIYKVKDKLVNTYFSNKAIFGSSEDKSSK